jgi:transcriptional regulator with XRE-family HTH domain
MITDTYSDKTLLEFLLYTTGFTQEELAKRLGFNRVQISKVIHGKAKLRPAVRHLANELCRKLREGQEI